MSADKENKGAVKAVDEEAIASLGRRPLTLPNPGEASYKNRITPITRHLAKRIQEAAEVSRTPREAATPRVRSLAGKGVFPKKATGFAPGKRLEKSPEEAAGEVRFRRRSYRHWSKRTIALYLLILSASGVLAFVVYQLMKK